MKIGLAGYSGSGVTTILALLSEDLELAGKHRGSLQMAPVPGEVHWRELGVSLEAEGPVAGVWRKQRDRLAREGVVMLNGSKNICQQMARSYFAM